MQENEVAFLLRLLDTVLPSGKNLDESGEITPMMILEIAISYRLLSQGLFLDYFPRFKRWFVYSIEKGKIS